MPPKKPAPRKHRLTPKRHGKTVRRDSGGDKPPALPKFRGDGWQNVYTALGVTDRDKRKSMVQSPELLEFGDCEDIYRGSDLGARIVELLPDEMLREGFEVAIADEEEASDELNEDLERLKVEDTLLKALYWQRAYGGAGIFVGANDGQTADKPLDPKRVRSVDWLTVYDRQELRPVSWYTDPNAPQFGEVELYGMFPKSLYITSAVQLKAFQTMVEQGAWTPSKLIHESRILKFTGIQTSRVQARAEQSWGDPVYNRVYEVLQDFETGFGSAAALVSDFAQAVVKLAGLAETVSQSSEDVIRARVEAIEMGRSTLRAMLLDKDDDFQRTSTPVAGLPDLLDKFMNRVAAAAGYPVTLLFGQAPAGLNATGDADVRWFYDKVRRNQRKTLRPAILRICELVMLSKGQSGDYDDVDVMFPALWQLTEGEEATRRLAVAQADKLYVDMSAVSPEEVAVARFSGARYSAELHIAEKDPAERMVASAEAAGTKAELAPPPTTEELPGGKGPTGKGPAGSGGAGMPGGSATEGGGSSPGGAPGATD